MGVPALKTAEVTMPTSREEAVSAFGDGAGVTVFGGGTILMPDITHGRAQPTRALLLTRAGLAGVRTEGQKTVVGAMTSVAALEDAPEPLGSAARGVADHEVRAQGTIGGNLCAGPGAESPRGDLQAALIALGAQVRSAGSGGERTQAVEDFLAGGTDGRLVLEIEFTAPEAGARATVGRPHGHTYTVLAVCAAKTADGVRVAASGAGPGAVRCASVERALAEGSDAETAAQRVLDDATPQDDALASAWYRERTLPLLVRRALNDLS